MSLLALGALLEGEEDYAIIDGNLGDDPLGEVVPSGHGLDADAGDYLQD